MNLRLKSVKPLHSCTFLIKALSMEMRRAHWLRCSHAGAVLPGVPRALFSAPPDALLCLPTRLRFGPWSRLVGGGRQAVGRPANDAPDLHSTSVTWRVFSANHKTLQLKKGAAEVKKRKRSQNTVKYYTKWNSSSVVSWVRAKWKIRWEVKWNQEFYYLLVIFILIRTHV